MKEFLKKYKVGIIIGVVLVLFVGLSLLMDNNQKDAAVLKDDVDEWIEETKGDTPIVTVYASSTCHNCASLKPIIEKLQKEYGFKTYWFEVNLLNEDHPDDYDKLMNTYKIEDYKNAVPFTFVMKNGEYLGNLLGAQSESSLLEFLKENDVVEG